MRNLITIILLLVFVQANATDYYIANTGSDADNGLSIGHEWKTINKVNTSTFSAGDRILLNCGDTWREQLTIPSSGTSGSYITFGSYGSGNKPRILGSKIETSWTNSSGNIWISTNTFTDPYALTWDAQIYFVETNGDISWGRVKKANTGACVAEYDWTWASNHIYIYSPTDPNTRYSGVEVTQREQTISINSKEYIVIDGLEIAYAGNEGIGNIYPPVPRTGLTVSNCHIHHIGIKESEGAYGVYAYYSNTTIKDNTIHDCGRRNVSLFITASGTYTVSNMIVENNTLYHGFHTTGIDCINIAASGSMDGIIIRKNFIWDDPSGILDQVESFKSIGIFIANQGGVGIRNVQIYNNIIKNNSYKAINTEGVTGLEIYNNTIYGSNPNLVSSDYAGGIVLTRGTSGIVKNNIFYNNSNHTTTASFGSLIITSDAGVVTSDYNLFYNTDASANVVDWYDTSYTTSQWTTYKSATSQDLHSPNPSNPMFISPSDYNLQSTSPAINAGVNVGLTTDYTGHVFEGLPDVGAYEYITPYTPPIVRTKGISAGGGKAWGIGGVPYGN